jgi:sarcosine oxidase subunit gamma
MRKNLAETLGSDARITDVSQGKVVLRLSGVLSRDLFAKTCPLDLRPKHFARGCCACSLVADVSMLIHAYDADGFDLFMDRSLARSVIHLLIDGSAEFASMPGHRGAP